MAMRGKTPSFFKTSACFRSSCCATVDEAADAEAQGTAEAWVRSPARAWWMKGSSIAAAAAQIQSLAWERP